MRHLTKVILAILVVIWVISSTAYTQDLPPATGDIEANVLKIETYKYFGMLKLKLTNTGRRPIKNIAVALGFKDASGELIDVILLWYDSLLLPGQSGTLDDLFVVPGNATTSFFFVYQAEYYNDLGTG